MKYLEVFQVGDLLKAGRRVEQWIGHTNSVSYRSITWIDIAKNQDEKYELAKHECFDFALYDVDIYSFERVDPDLLEGEVSKYSSVDEALLKAEELYGANVHKYVGYGFVKDEYLNFLSEFGEFAPGE